MYRASSVNIHIQLPTIYIHYIYSYTVVIYSCCITRSTEQSCAFFVAVSARSHPRAPSGSIPSITALLRWSLPSEMTVDLCKCGATLRTLIAGIAKKSLVIFGFVCSGCMDFSNED